MAYNGRFRQTLAVSIKSESHNSCLDLTKFIKYQCEAWKFCVKYDESKSARKGPVFGREIMIYQEDYSSDTIIFKEAIRIICFNLNNYSEKSSVTFIDRGSIPIEGY